jgi:coniferyl-aldehyde dehydrogenase
MRAQEPVSVLTPRGDVGSALQRILERQRRAFLQEGCVTAATRIERLDRAAALLRNNATRLCEAMSADFGHRSKHQAQMTDIDLSLGSLSEARKYVRSWMRAERRRTMFPLSLLGARARVEYQPLGVVGCMSPWNFPVQLSFGPLAGILAAGNRAMLKPSELTPTTAELIRELVAAEFSIEEVAVFPGGVDVARQFSQLAFDHLIFTGSAGVARQIMGAAARNLVPLTLELGGKSPVIVGESADIEATAARVMMGKTMNAGQLCLAPDYVWLSPRQLEPFIQAAVRSVAKMFPRIRDNPDYTSMVNQQHYERVRGYIEDALAKGARVLEINPAAEEFQSQKHRRIPPTLVIHPTDEMLVMQEEVFGPVLSLKCYSGLDEVLGYINAKPRPLALYYFGRDPAEQRRVLSGTTSGGVTVNDVTLHAGQEDLPFGGVGASGMGSYHGQTGFKTFSHARAVFIQSSLVAKLAQMMRPPYTKSP